jgi:hypothetical protein
MSTKPRSSPNTATHSRRVRVRRRSGSPAPQTANTIHRNMILRSQQCGENIPAKGVSICRGQSEWWTRAILNGQGGFRRALLLGCLVAWLLDVLGREPATLSNVVDLVGNAPSDAREQRMLSQIDPRDRTRLMNGNELVSLRSEFTKRGLFRAATVSKCSETVSNMAATQTASAAQLPGGISGFINA